MIIFGIFNWVVYIMWFYWRKNVPPYYPKDDAVKNDMKILAAISIVKYWAIAENPLS